ncbi:hypothetical protein BKA70DRAFT_7146 [Coprinopsis sp. MPI-PUGE-AT-0042]|nr:hypothetical protein BKA70DRAFT_7146 [Coprinopsis sp. MPI-PUGE-AT-0042]
MASPTYLQSMDIWYLIAATLDPPDILALRATCSALLGLCGERSIWLQAARAMCRSHGLFLPSFPFETMTIKELTRLALSPFAFSRLVSTEGNDRLFALQTRSFNPRLHGSEDMLDLRSLHLLPGGRYLLTYHRQHVCMWDLGYRQVSPKPFPIAVLHMKRSVQVARYGQRDPCPTADGKGVCVLVLSQYVDPDPRRSTLQLMLTSADFEVAWTLGMYEIYPASEEPTFRCTDTWQLPHEGRILKYSSQYVVLIDHDMVHVYAVSDPKVDGPRCSLRDLWKDGDFPRAVILGDTVIIWVEDNQAAMKVVSIPRTSTSTTTLSFPNLIIPTSIWGNSKDTVYTSEWAERFTSNGFFALAAGAGTDTTELHLYQMVDLAPSTKLRLPFTTPAKVGKVSIENWGNFVGGPNLQPLSSDFAVIGFNGGWQVTVAKIVISRTTDLHEDSEELPAPSVKTLTNEPLYEENDIYVEVSACVATGRLVTAHTTYVNENVEWLIRVIDYLSPI